MLWSVVCVRYCAWQWLRCGEEGGDNIRCIRTYILVNKNGETWPTGGISSIANTTLHSEVDMCLCVHVCMYIC